MTPYEERDEQLRQLIRREIEKAKKRAADCGWHPSQKAWHRAFGELSGMHKILQMIDPDANKVEVSISTRF